MSLLFSGTLAKRPSINFILPHAGGTLPFLAPRMAAVGSLPALGERAMAPGETMAAFTRLFYDTALSTTPQQIAALRALAPVSQIVYGTDFPFAPEERLRMAGRGCSRAWDGRRGGRSDGARRQCDAPVRGFGGEVRGAWGATGTVLSSTCVIPDAAPAPSRRAEIRGPRGHIQRALSLPGDQTLAPSPLGPGSTLRFAPLRPG